jgi:hypothetical protein
VAADWPLPLQALFSAALGLYLFYVLHAKFPLRPKKAKPLSRKAAAFWAALTALAIFFSNALWPD